MTTGQADTIPVMIDSSGQLGTASSSRRVKTDIHAMLLGELQKQHVQLREQTVRLGAQQREIDELRAQVRALIGGSTAAKE